MRIPRSLEEDLVQLVVVVLAGVDQHVLAVPVEPAITRDSRMISGRVPTIVMTLSIDRLAHDVAAVNSTSLTSSTSSRRVLCEV